ncbi:unnamed protein product [Prorocentrum cordatum]|uniref:Uncharacterized protein n=1 Tax=Prorocentrum cordatum TaxID=2364126 RepID=A0ABN9RCS0_9DINO|nr:unnamed protein product [Polarella glacialis]
MADDITGQLDLCASLSKLGFQCSAQPPTYLLTSKKPASTDLASLRHGSYSRAFSFSTILQSSPALASVIFSITGQPLMVQSLSSFQFENCEPSRAHTFH